MKMLKKMKFKNQFYKELLRFELNLVLKEVTQVIYQT